MATTAVLVMVDNDIWQSVVNRSPAVKTSMAVEYIFLKFLTEVYPKEKETHMRVSIDKNAHEELRKKFAAIVKEIRGETK
jgi:hypothetical protein